MTYVYPVEYVNPSCFTWTLPSCKFVHSKTCKHPQLHRLDPEWQTSILLFKQVQSLPSSAKATLKYEILVIVLYVCSSYHFHSSIFWKGLYILKSPFLGLTLRLLDPWKSPYSRYDIIALVSYSKLIIFFDSRYLYDL